ncbi:patatin-like phospholipase family protein [Candidatus Berkiella aquae]|uniref:Patatin-like phospholipase n=1 Tax=Candidatus Berkiella aquae TaxID=295108 RepID=A0A0Q9YXI7_9GAMM|nr:patatin-like phospholipase family protein [Candidatus Berkiella aquae]MCS5711590.1 patatin-like phospholipase family protein [Candidatus Berkiella aquae]
MANTHIKSINLALQGGGAHGAFCWGVLDYLLQDGRVHFEGISATSAGAANAIVLAQGLLNDSHDEARRILNQFWERISQTGVSYSQFKGFPFMNMLTQGKFDQFSLDDSLLFSSFDLMTKVFSPYQFNPFNINPLRTILEETVNFNEVRSKTQLKLFICATNVETCKIRIFDHQSISVDAILASACLPFLFQAVEIEGEYFWDGGYIGNPAIFPLIYHCQSQDVVISHINPIVRKGVPKTATEILNRVNEISFNSSLMREMRAISFVSKLIDNQTIAADKMKKMYIHSIRSDEEMATHSVSSKMNTDWQFLKHLKDKGREVAKQWLDNHFHDLGKKSSIDIDKEFL